MKVYQHFNVVVCPLLFVFTLMNNMDLWKYNFDLNWLFLLLPFKSLTMDVLRLSSTFFILYGLVPSDSAAKLKPSCYIFLLRKSRLALSHRHLFSSIMLSNTSFSSILNVFSCVSFWISTASTSPMCTSSVILVWTLAMNHDLRFLLGLRSIAWQDRGRLGSQIDDTRLNSCFCHHCNRCDRCRSRKRFYFL